jgi:orotate phosphoribosyltransferase-like protein
LEIMSMNEDLEAPQMDQWIEQAESRQEHFNSVYKPEYVKRAFDLAKIGLTHDQMALAIGVGYRAFNKWLVTKPEFNEAVRMGKEIFDSGVELTLLQRAMGYDYDEVKEVTGVDSQGRPYHYTTKTTKKVLPDVTAQIFWLKNRKKERWADVHKQETSLSLNMQKTLKMELLDEKEREMVKSIAVKSLSGINDINQEQE